MTDTTLPLARPEDLREAWETAQPGLLDYLQAQVAEGFAGITPFQFGRAGAARGTDLPTASFELGDMETVVPSGLPSLEEAQAMVADRRELLPVLTGTQTKEQIERLVRDYDARRAREEVIARRQPGLGERGLGFLAQMAGSLPDPVNLLPLGGSAWQAARGARVASRLAALRSGAIAGARENVLGTLVTAPLVAAGERAIGGEYGFEDLLVDLAAGVVVGGALGGAGHWWAARRATPAATADLAAPPATPPEFRAIQDAVPPELVDRAAQRINLAAEQVLGGAPVRAADVPSPAPEEQRMLIPRVAVTPRGRQVPVTYEVRDLSELIASQLEGTLEANPRYPQELQPRDRSSAASEEAIRRLAANLDVSLLGPTPTATDGAPIIDATGNVLSGNGRVLALAQAYADPAAAGKLGEYRAMIEALGFDTAGKQRPVLLRRAEVDGEEARAVAREANERPAGVPAQSVGIAEVTPVLARAAAPTAVAEAGGLIEAGPARVAPSTDDPAADLAAAEAQLAMIPRDEIPDELRKELDASEAGIAKAEAGVDAWQAAAACILRAA